MKVKTFLMTDISIINEELLKKLKKGDLLYETNNTSYRHNSCRLTHQKILRKFSTELRLKNNLLFVENTLLPVNIKNFPYFQIILSYFPTYDGRVVEIYNGKNILIKNICYQFNLIFYRKVKSNSLVEIYLGELSFG